MNTQFQFATATRIVFGAKTIREAGSLAKEMGKCALVVTGRDARRAGVLLERLQEAGGGVSIYRIEGEPDLDCVRRGVAQAGKDGCDSVIGFGGGSVLDAGKAIAAMLTNGGDLVDYVEIIGRGKEIARPAAPFLAIPTTAGTGAEVTRNAVLASPEHRVKVSLRSRHLLPAIALIDPELTFDLPPNLTASTGLDALTQLIEPYVCVRANPMTDALCEEGMRRAARSLRAAFLDGKNAAAREDMCVASLFGGLALANAGLGAVHGLAGPIGGMYPAPHGAICAALLAQVMQANLAALRSRQPASPALARYEAVARFLTGNPAAQCEDGVEWVRRLVAEMKVPGLSAYGIAEKGFAEIVERVAKASSMKANPIELTAKELADIVAAAL
jgi:alcohol dehydrogenase class IV